MQTAFGVFSRQICTPNSRMFFSCIHLYNWWIVSPFKDHNSKLYKLSDVRARRVAVLAKLGVFLVTM